MEKQVYADSNQPNNLSDRFNSDGFFFMKDQIPKEVIQNFENVTKKLFSTVAKEDETVSDTVIRLNKEDAPLLYRIYQTLSKMGETDDLRRHCFEIMNKLYPGKFHVELGAGLLMGIPSDERLAYDWHQEVHYHEEFDDVIHFWIPVINEANIANGTMSILTSSHTKGKLDYALKAKTRPDSVTNLVIQEIPKLKEDHPEVFFKAQPGDIVGLDAYTVHRSNANSSNEVRFIVSCRLAAIDKVPSAYDFEVKA